MLERIDHVALAVSDLDAALAHFRDVWGVEVAYREVVADQGVEEALLDFPGTALQLVAPTRPDSPVAKFLARRGEGLHHVAYEVADLAAALRELRARGAELIDQRARRGGRGRRIAFVHPQSSHGVLVELVQRPAP